MAGRFSVEAVFKAVDRITAPVSRMQNRIGKFARTTEHQFNRISRASSKMTQSIKQGVAASILALASLTAAASNVVTTGADFEQTLVNAAVKFPGEIRRGTEAFDRLEKTARRVGSTTEFTASQSAQALNFLAMAGFDANAAVSALPGVVDLATAAQVGLADATDIATDSLGAFNLLTKDTAQLQRNLTRVSDVLAKTTTSANTSMTQMFEAIKDGAPVATAAGASVETVATFIAKMADAGIKGTRAGTALKNIFLAISAPGSQAAQVMRRLGIETADAAGNLRDPLQVFKDFAAATDQLPRAQKMAAFNAIFGKIPIAAALNLTNAAGSMHAFREELEKSQGAAETMASVMRDTLTGRMKSVQSAVEGTLISSFKRAAPQIETATDRILELVRANEELIATRVGGFLGTVADNFESIAEKVLFFGKAIAVLFLFNTAVQTLTGAITLLNLVMAANPIVLITAAVAAAAVLIYQATVNTRQFIETLDKAPTAIRYMLAPLRLVLGILQKVKDGLGWAVDKAVSLGRWAGLGEDDDPATTVGDATGFGAFVMDPQARLARSIEERRETRTDELIIRDETGRAEMRGGSSPSRIKLTPSGAN